MGKNEFIKEKIVVVEGDIQAYQSLLHFFNEKTLEMIEFIHARNESEAFLAFEEYRPRIAIVSIANGVKLVETVKTRFDLGRTQFLLITDEEIADEAHYGANTSITLEKGFPPKRFLTWFVKMFEIANARTLSDLQMEYSKRFSDFSQRVFSG